MPNLEYERIRISAVSEIDKAIDMLSAFIRKNQEKVHTWPSPGGDTEWPEVWFTLQGLGGLAMRGQDAQDYRVGLDSLTLAYAKTLGEPIDLDEIASALEEPVQVMMLSSLDPDDKHPDVPFKARLDRARRVLKDLLVSRAVTWRVAVKTLGLVVDERGLRVGNVQFVRARSDAGQMIVQSIAQYFSGDIAQAAASREMIISVIAEDVDDKALAVTDVDAATQEVARVIALTRFRRAIDVLNFHATYLPESRDAHAYLPGEGSQLARYIVLFDQKSGNVQEGASLFTSTFFGSDDPILANGFLGTRANVTLNKVSAILAKKAPTEIEERIVTAMQWVGRAASPRRREESFLFCAIALETLLLEESSTPELTSRLKHRVAHLLGTNKEARMAIAVEIARLYGTRSKIVHRGKTNVTQAEYESIQSYARLAIFRLLLDDQLQLLVDFRALASWFDERIYS